MAWSRLVLDTATLWWGPGQHVVSPSIRRRRGSSGPPIDTYERMSGLKCVTVTVVIVNVPHRQKIRRFNASMSELRATALSQTCLTPASEFRVVLLPASSGDHDPRQGLQ